MVVSLSGTPLAVHPHLPLGVMGDEASLRQVFSNLVGNANRHTPAGSPVDIAVGATEHGTLLVEVRDHGPGLDEEQREKVFEDRKSTRLNSSHVAISYAVFCR